MDSLPSIDEYKSSLDKAIFILDCFNREIQEQQHFQYGTYALNILAAINIINENERKSNHVSS